MTDIIQLQSETIGALAKAKAAAQAELQDPVKTREVKVKSAKANFSYSFADLNDCAALIRPVFSKHGLAITQRVLTTWVADDPLLVISTQITHGESGEWERDWYALPFAKGRTQNGTEYLLGHQEQAKLITFNKRYSLVTMCLCCPKGDDDDGNSLPDSLRGEVSPPKEQPRQPRQQGSQGGGGGSEQKKHGPHVWHAWGLAGKVWEDYGERGKQLTFQVKTLSTGEVTSWEAMKERPAEDPLWSQLEERLRGFIGGEGNGQEAEEDDAPF